MTEKNIEIDRNTSSIKGVVVAELRDGDGNLKVRCETHNLVTAVGDQYYAGRAALSSGLPNQVTGFRLGSGTVAPSKTGAGSALNAYIPGSNKPCDAGFPTAAGGVVTFKRTYAPGEATTTSAVTEVVLNTDNISNDNANTATSANTIARALLTGISSKGAADTLTITWTHTILGA